MGALVSSGGSGFSVGGRSSICAGEDLGLSASSLEGGFGLTPFTYVVEGRVAVEKGAVVDTGELTLVSEKTCDIH